MSNMIFQYMKRGTSVIPQLHVILNYFNYLKSSLGSKVQFQGHLGKYTLFHKYSYERVK